MTSYTLTLPYPPTANLYWRLVNNRMVRSKAAKDYTSYVQQVGMVNRLKPLLGPIEVQIQVFRPRKVGDLDNTLKVLIDSLRGVAYGDDSQIIRITAERFDDKEAPRAEIIITQSETVC